MADAVKAVELRIGLDHAFELAQIDRVVVVLKRYQLERLPVARGLKAQMVVEHAVGNEPRAVLQVFEQQPCAFVREYAASSARLKAVDHRREQHYGDGEPSERMRAPDAGADVGEPRQLFRDIRAVGYDEVPVHDHVPGDHGREGI